MQHQSRYNYVVAQKGKPVLLFNTRTHALVELGAEEFSRYQNGSLYEEELATLTEMRFFCDEKTDEILEIETARQHHCMYHPQLDLTVMVAERCNFDCPYCYQAHDQRTLTEEKTDNFCKFLEHVYTHQTHTVNITWFGGEPLLNMDSVFRVERLLRELNFEGISRMVTNGYLLTDHLLERMKNETRIRALQITLDGTPDQHNLTRRHITGAPTYETICKNISLAVKQGFYTVIRVNLNKQNQSLDPFFTALSKYGLDNSKHAVHITNAHQFEKSEALENFYFESASEYAKAYSNAQDAFIKAGYQFPRNYTKGVGCEFECNNTFLVSCDLDLFFCSSCEQESFYKQGRIDSDGRLILNEQYHNRKELAASVFNDADCADCIVLPMCMGGCTLQRLKGKKFCIPEKYFLDDYVMKLYREQEENL